MAAVPPLAVPPQQSHVNRSTNVSSSSSTDTKVQRTFAARPDTPRPTSLSCQWQLSGGKYKPSSKQ